MDVVLYGKDKYPYPCVLLLGYFDAMHVGHRRLAAYAKELAEKIGARVGIMTFTGAKKGGQVFVYEERLYLFESLGMQFAYPAVFDDAFRDTSGGAFLNTVCSQLQVRAFVCGEDFTFGKGALCGVSELNAFCADRGISVYALPLVDCGGAKAAASNAKALLDRGDLTHLEKLLGGKYFVRGVVSGRGRQVGRTIGFPTANLYPPSEKYPLRSGVYAVSAQIGGKRYRGIANYGARPTFGEDNTVLEIYFAEFSGDLYGKEIVVYFDFFIRDVRKFGSAEELKIQLKKDLEKIR